jgi:hypothetical protein
LLREIIRTLRAASKPLAITASTGIASVNIGGTTLHSWAGIGLGKEPAIKLAPKILHQPKLHRVRERWVSVETLIIDESKLLYLSVYPAQYSTGYSFNDRRFLV